MESQTKEQIKNLECSKQMNKTKRLNELYLFSSRAFLMKMEIFEAEVDCRGKD